MIIWLLRIPFFPPPAAQRAARTLVPSTHHNSSSIAPASTCAARNRRKISSSVPSPFHLSNRSQIVAHGPNSSGRSRQGEPVLRIHKIPSTTARRSRGGRPVRAGFGKTSSTQADTDEALVGFIAKRAVVIVGHGAVLALRDGSDGQRVVFRIGVVGNYIDGYRRSRFDLVDVAHGHGRLVDRCDRNRHGARLAAAVRIAHLVDKAVGAAVVLMG